MTQINISGNIVDIHSRETFRGTIIIEGDRIAAIVRDDELRCEGYIIPPLIDSHLHIESSMLTPENFGHLVAPHGTVAVVTDPHEIANVMGVEGIEFMMESAARSPIECYFTIPSCVPATPFDVTGAVIDSAEVESLAASGRFVALSEMMNIPGVLGRDPEVMSKLESAKNHNLPIDGHAPLLVGEPLREYIAAGITTDHESVVLEAAREKIATGMKIQIREGSAARNYHTLSDLLRTNPEDVLFCTDDSHPDEIIARGHIDKLVRAAIGDGYDLYDVLRCASLNAIEHYRLPIGALRVGDRADFVVVDNLKDFKAQATYIKGTRVEYSQGKQHDYRINNFNHEPITLEQLEFRSQGEITTIDLIKDEIITNAGSYTPSSNDNLESDLEQDIHKIVYINRYQNSKPVVAFVRGMGLKRGALASSIAHDSHNIIAVGSSDKELQEAINEVIRHKGALAACCAEEIKSIPLPIAGIMSNSCGEELAREYSAINSMVREMGSTLSAPFMSLSFLSLVVIPELKIGEKGLFSFSKFDYI